MNSTEDFMQEFQTSKFSLRNKKPYPTPCKREKAEKIQDDEKYKLFPDKRRLEEAYEWIRNNTTGCLLFIALILLISVIYVTTLNVQLSNELRKKPCEKLLCYRENRRLQSEIRSFNPRIHKIDINLQDEIQSFHQKKNNIETELQMLQNYCTSIAKKVEIKHSVVKREQHHSLVKIDIKFQKLQAETQSIHKKVNNIDTELQILQNPPATIDLQVEDKHCEVKKERHYSLVYFLLVFMTYMTFALFFWMDNKVGICEKTSEKTTKALSNVPGVVYFGRHQLPHLLSLTKSFLGDQNNFLITEEKDLPQISSKLAFLFVDFNDRYTILEGEYETSQLKRRTVEAVENAGGKAVVIYQFHPDSRALEDGCLYWDDLRSIQNHPVLKKLSKEGCVLTIYKEFSDYQKSHLGKLCQKYSTF